MAQSQPKTRDVRFCDSRTCPLARNEVLTRQYHVHLPLQRDNVVATDDSSLSSTPIALYGNDPFRYLP